MAFARRRSLEKRGTLTRPAESALSADELQTLHAALQDEDRRVRLAAIIITGDLGDATFVPDLEASCKQDDREIQLAAINSLGEIGGTESASWLTHLAGDHDGWREVRLAALTQLEELAAKQITSGPDRRFDPSTGPVSAVPPMDQSIVQASLPEVLESIESESDADDLLRLKASDVRSYLEG
jgi:hypothetical protein